MFLTALDLLDNTHELYVQAGRNETVKSVLNRAFFTRLSVDGGKVTDHELNEPFDLLSDAYAVYQDEEATERVAGHKQTSRCSNGSAALLTELPGRRHSSQTASSADLPAEIGATCRNDLIRYLTAFSQVTVQITG